MDLIFTSLNFVRGKSIPIKASDGSKNVSQLNGGVGAGSDGVSKNWVDTLENCWCLAK